MESGGNAGKRPLDITDYFAPDAKCPRINSTSPTVIQPVAVASAKASRVRKKCPHSREPSRCRDCWTNKSALCELHQRMRDRCVPCTQKYPDDARYGSALCREHWIPRQDCNKHPSDPRYGASVCPCGRAKNTCRTCNGTKFCKHNKRTGTCDKPGCSSAARCKHGKFKTSCIQDGCHPEKACRCCKAVIALHKKYKPYCGSCYYQLNPEQTPHRNFMTKELLLREVLKTAFPLVNFTFNQKVAGGTSRRMPDVLKQCPEHSVIVECSEFQHRHPGYACEQKRMMELFMDLGSRPLVMISFNPDGYKTNSRRVSGCFTTTPKAGKLKVKTTEWNRRMEILLPIIQQAIETIPSKEITEHVLFYDGYK